MVEKKNKTVQKKKTIKKDVKSEMKKVVPNVKKQTKEKKQIKKDDIHKGDTMAEDNKLILAITYLLGIFAFIIYLVKKEDSNIKFHALQSIVINAAVFIFFMAISIVMVPLTMVSGGICGIAYLPLMVVPFILYLYILFKVITTGDLELPYLTEFVKKNLKQYY